MTTSDGRTTDDRTTDDRTTDDRVPVAGSERRTATRVPVTGSQQATVTVVLRRRTPLPSVESLESPLSSEALAERFGADPGDVATVSQVVQAAGLRVEETSTASRTMRVTGTVDELSTFFGTRLYEATVPGQERTFRARHGALTVPGALGEVVVAVLGLDDRPQAYPRSERAASAATSFTPPELAALYGMPESDGAGQTIAIIEFGGGFAQSDLDHYFGGLGLPTPSVRAVGVDGAKNVPGKDPNGADGEVLLDIEVAGGIAPAAHQVVYFAPNTDAGFLDAVTTATHATPRPVAISISWGQSEDQWTPQARAAMDDAFADAGALGITVTCAAGDTGSGDTDPAGGNHVDFPASSPHALGCGGTTLRTSGGKVTSETVWNSNGSTGGGVSDVFPTPSWQAKAGVPTRPTGGRGVPDVAAVADPNTGYEVFVDGHAAVYGGTSAVAPLWAGLVARIAHLTGESPGFVQPALYAGAAPGTASTALRDITSGNNGAFAAGPGWDACTGLGVPEPATAAVLGAGG
ncbi:protease pro-enzyme activation domain-containing protein [Cellulomonas sp. URHD0024]|uniref:S53 family peptidase n=1 Tax=Cellulomonas sp. URHD0024 TaxID=1302620 RepID=UPI00040D92F9|nr:S53 family peptidase [Cellulomonas sp. URHD0024]